MGYDNLRWVDLPKGTFFTIEGSHLSFFYAIIILL